MTGPKVLRGRETSMLWFGINGVWMARGVLGMTPKLGERMKKILEVNQEAGFSHVFEFQGLVTPCEGNIIFL